MNERIEWIDVAKGIGMVLVMFIHAPLPSLIRGGLNSFVVPLFFFLSGCLFIQTKYPSMKIFIKKRIKTLLIPYFSFSLINYLLWITFYRYQFGSGDYKNISSIIPIIGTFFPLRGTENTVHNGALWFVPCLFTCEIMLFLIIKHTRNKYYKIITYIFILSLLGYVYSIYVKRVLPWSLEVSLMACAFYGTGYMLRNKLDRLVNSKAALRLFVFFTLVNLSVGFLNKRVNMFYNLYGNYLLYYMAAFAGIFAIIIFANSIGNVKILKYIGKNSIIFLALHQFAIYPIVGLFLNDISVFKNESALITLARGSCYVISAIIILMPITYIVNKHLPFIIGKQPGHTVITYNTQQLNELGVNNE